jgi:hypothetical protein
LQVKSRKRNSYGNKNENWADKKTLNNQKQQIYEPRHDKTNIMGVRPACIQTSLRIHAV